MVATQFRKFTKAQISLKSNIVTYNCMTKFVYVMAALL